MTLALVVTACGGLEEEAIEPFEDEECVLENGPEEAADIAQSSQALPDGTPQIVYVNFDGPTITHCPACSDARINKSRVLGYLGHPTTYNFAPFTNSTWKRSIMNYLKGYFAPYNITFTTTRPTTGDYTMAIVSPSWFTSGSHGIAPLDCNNTNRNDIAFVYRTGEARRFPTAAKVAQAVAHEIGHSLGLSHVTASTEIMQYASSGGKFSRATYDTRHVSGKCFSGTVQDAPAMLTTAVGPRP